MTAPPPVLSYLWRQPCLPTVNPAPARPSLSAGPSDPTFPSPYLWPGFAGYAEDPAVGVLLDAVPEFGPTFLSLVEASTTTPAPQPSSPS